MGIFFIDIPKHDPLFGKRAKHKELEPPIAKCLGDRFAFQVVFSVFLLWWLVIHLQFSLENVSVKNANVTNIATNELINVKAQQLQQTNDPKSEQKCS